MAVMTIESLQKLVNESDISTIPNNKVSIKLHDGVVSMKMRHAILHLLIWKPLFQYGIPVTKDECYDLYPMTRERLSEVHTAQYKKLLELLPKVHYTEIVMSFWRVIFDFYLFNFKYTAAYTQGLDLVDMVEITRDPKLLKLTHGALPITTGSGPFETEIRNREKEMMKIIKTKGALGNTALYYPMMAGIYKVKQITQLFIALGSRSDIDDRVLPHMISRSGVQGMNCIADLFTESTSSKKTTHFNSTIIRDVQSWHREMRLYTCNLIDKIPGDCGRRTMLEKIIPEGKGHNYIDKIVALDGNTFAVDNDNCREIEGKKIDIVSPVFCNYVTGVCEHCAGRATKHPWKYIPDVRLGGYGTSIICSSASQKVLSAKHLIQVLAILASLDMKALRYFVLGSKDMIKFDLAKFRATTGKFLVLSRDDIGHLNDMDHVGITPEGFGQIKTVGIFDEAIGDFEMFPLSSDNVIEYLSKPMFQHLKRSRSKVILKENNYYIPLEGFDTKKAVFSIVELNDDMKAYVLRIKRMFTSGIAECPTIHMAVSQVADIIHSKMDVNIFFIELVIKAIVNDVLPDDGRYQFKKLGEGIASYNVATKLGHSYVKRYLRSPAIVAEEKTESPFDALYGWGSDVD